MIVYYFGADVPWDNQSPNGLNRRNMAVLWAISQQSKVIKVYNVIRCTRNLLFNKRQQVTSQQSKIQNLYIAPVLPERGWLGVVTRLINQLILRIYHRQFWSKDNSISWCYWPKGYKDFKLLGINNRMIFDTDHNIIDDPNLDETQKNQRASLLIKAGKEAKLIISSARSMLNWFKDEGLTNTVLMFNGVFKNRIKIDAPKTTDSSSFQVTYCGTLSKWIKIDWLLQLAKDNANWTINVIGKNYKTELDQELEKLSNIKLHGFLKPDKVDEILKSSHVCIGLYKEIYGMDVNSMKLYDYLAKGKPVVVNKYHRNLVQDFEHLVQVESTYKAFLRTVTSPKAQDPLKLKTFLEKALWENRVKAVLCNLEREQNGY